MASASAPTDQNAAGEYLVRLLVVPRSERSGFFQAVTAYRQFSGSKPVERR